MKKEKTTLNTTQDKNDISIDDTTVLVTMPVLSRRVAVPRRIFMLCCPKTWVQPFIITRFKYLSGLGKLILKYIKHGMLKISWTPVEGPCTIVISNKLEFLHKNSHLELYDAVMNKRYFYTIIIIYYIFTSNSIQFFYKWTKSMYFE